MSSMGSRWVSGFYDRPVSNKEGWKNCFIKLFDPLDNKDIFVRVKQSNTLKRLETLARCWLFELNKARATVFF